jgi:predicted nuclease with TOPRIM domain
VAVCTTYTQVIPVSDETVVETDGVTVSKFFNAEDFPVPAVAFEVASTRDADVTLTITDEIPDEFGIDQIGFHPEYGSEHWTATGDGVVRFEREVDASEEFTTVYGVRMEDGQDETPFLSAPDVEVDGEDIDEVVPPESTDVVRELAGGERDTVPGLEDDDEVEVEAGVGASGGIDTTVDDDAEILGDEAGLIDDDGDDANEEPAFDDSAAEPLAAEEDGDAEYASEDASFDDGDSLSDEGTALDAGSSFGHDGANETDFGAEDDETDLEAELDADLDAEPDPVDPEPATDPVGFDEGQVAAALAEAIRNDEVADEDLETIQGALGGVPQSTEVEIDHLQSRVSELEAYTDALEAFIDENGPAQEVLSEFEGDIADLENELADVHADVASVEEAVADADDDREDLQAQVDDVESKFGAVDDLEESLDRLRGDVDALDERLADTEEDVLALEDVEADIEELSEDIDDVEATVEEIDEWRNQLSDVLGA